VDTLKVRSAAYYSIKCVGAACDFSALFLSIRSGGWRIVVEVGGMYGGFILNNIYISYSSSSSFIILISYSIEMSMLCFISPSEDNKLSLRVSLCVRSYSSRSRYATTSFYIDVEHSLCYSSSILYKSPSKRWTEVLS
jgi:hypothetical protein